ncbi:MAG TPA: chloride channel protein, partial [Phycisphaerae bacterium]|nr:chloride channel protein [Phycisphaerae bacterium]
MPRPATAWVRLLTISVIVGLLSGLAAAALEAGLSFGSERLVGRYVEVGGQHLWRFHWQLVLLPAIGGLLSGVIVGWLCKGGRGHGTDTLVRAFHYEGGHLPMWTPTIQSIASIGVISCGGSAGPEGPIAALGAAIGSSMARVLALTPRERRVMLIAGCGAGIGAIFQCPMGGALFAAGILYRDPDYETDAFIPAFVAAVMGYAVYLPIWGKHLPLMETARSFTFSHPFELAPYLLLGVACGLVSIFFYKCLHFVEGLPYEKWRIPRWLAPALGGLATGAIACAIPPVMDGQYLFIRNAMKDAVQTNLALTSLWPLVLLFGAVAIGKCIATAFTVGSGAAGGVLGPSVFIGGAVGAFVGA